MLNALAGPRQRYSWPGVCHGTVTPFVKVPCQDNIIHKVVLLAGSFLPAVQAEPQPGGQYVNTTVCYGHSGPPWCPPPSG